MITQGHGRQVQEWTLPPEKPDNHWFDCLVGCAVGASMAGVKRGDEEVVVRKRRVVDFAEMQRKAREGRG